MAKTERTCYDCEHFRTIIPLSKHKKEFFDRRILYNSAAPAWCRKGLLIGSANQEKVIKNPVRKTMPDLVSLRISAHGCAEYSSMA